MLERGFGGQSVDEFQPDGWPEGHGECDGPIQLYDGRRR